MANWSFEADCGWVGKLPGGCLVANFTAVWASMLAWIVAIVLGLAALVVDVWGFWGFSIALATSVIFVPFMLYERLHFLFDGWIKFFVGFLIYVIVARINLALVASVVMMYLKSNVQDLLSGAGPQMVIPVAKYADVMGMQLFMGVGIFTLCATGSFARAMVGGAGGGGVQFGAMAKAASTFVAGAATAKAIVGAAAEGAKNAQGDGARAMLKSAGGAAVDKLVETQQGNRDFRAGYAIGREARAGAMNGGRGLSLGADSKAIAKADANAWDRAGTALGSAMGGAGAAARAAGQMALGRKVEDSFANARHFASALERGEQTAKSANQTLERMDKGLSATQQQSFRAAITAHEAVLNSKTTPDNVSERTEALRESTSALSEMNRDMKLSGGSAMALDKSSTVLANAAQVSERLGSKLSDSSRAELQSGMQNATQMEQTLREVENSAKLSAEADAKAIGAKGISVNAVARATTQAQANAKTHQALREEALNNARQATAALDHQVKSAQGEVSLGKAEARALNVGWSGSIKVETHGEWASEERRNDTIDKLEKLDQVVQDVGKSGDNAADAANLRMATDDAQEAVRAMEDEAKKNHNEAKQQAAAKSGKPRLREKASDTSDTSDAQ
jgi:TrbL/VirB6 plasmid conjugal transfer protein